ncbi:MAG: hypothetical protein MZW92_01645 [Comamonadaceae bacterium]|nr:hypothetical protein [Comamonadaceae bacterium]
MGDEGQGALELGDDLAGGGEGRAAFGDGVVEGLEPGPELGELTFEDTLLEGREGVGSTTLASARAVGSGTL